MEQSALDPKILGQILLLQSTIYTAPDEIRLGEQVCYALISVPGIKSTAFYINEALVASETTDSRIQSEWPLPWSDIIEIGSSDQFSEYPVKLFPMQTRKKRYGYLVLVISDNEEGSKYLPFVENTVNQIALLIENRKQDAELRELNIDLEKQVIERTKALHESEKLFRSTFESAAIGMCLTSKDGYLMMVNPALCRMLGYSEAELMSRKFEDFTHDADIHSSHKKITHLLDGKAQNMLFEKRFVHNSGRIVWAIVGTFLVRDSQDKPQYFVTHIQDITERKQAEKEREKFARRLATHIEQTPLGVIEWDLNFRVVHWNPAARKIFGYTREQAIGKHATDLIVTDEAGEHVGLIWDDLITKKGGKKSVNRNITKDGKILTCEWYNTTSIDPEGEVVGVISLVQDITEVEKNKEEKINLERQLHQSQKMEAIGTLAGGIAHDFNNILSVILGYSDILKEDLFSESSEEIDQIINAGNRAKDLVHQILAFSRQGRKEFSPLQPHLIIIEALKMLRASIPSTIKIKHDVPKCGFIIGDPTQLHQIIMNLCTNAYHAMRETGGVLEVSLEPIVLAEDDIKTLSLVLSPGSYLKLEISDTGHGIDKATQLKIFDPYFTTKKKGEGTGLGLAVVHGIVKSFGGHISVYSVPAKGTTFCVYLPQIIPEKEKRFIKHTGTIPTGDEHILLVDDEAPIAQMEKKMLESLGYQVSVCTSSPEALKIFQNQPEDFALVIADMTMPDMTGAELIQRILTINPKIPTMLCSGFSELINEEKAKRIGIRKYLMKPIMKFDFATAVRALLDEGKMVE